ncbi:T9SS type A sorting domain-containing protein [Flammeovirga kamogawensis]|uniref:T9SS type A sorting domain-containing protein n=1 Tax=Flammeovirga kamogawensis TaxID=373891 RepID=A0ABX8GXG8_9BACT|nr:T9SS type A sorting domain-containing protein [Flammeovirga kamogawensis]MBB6461248.1 hypothetical protein [Flammeovirga kamogawensis]QWG07807.1 T9SS type A sorting domain-containing protein [Flammeovirga kamogawensis]TRX69613.1 T9SS type A sorting domain-containing protein [Flammeovirga kamogawensis]
MKALTINTNSFWRILLIGLIFYSIGSFAQTTYKPVSNIIFDELTDWTEPDNWVRVSGDLPDDYPQGTDIIQFGYEEESAYKSISIGFDLTTISSNLNFFNLKGGGTPGTITITSGGNAIINSIEDNNQYTKVVVENGAKLIVSEELSWTMNPSTLDIQGEFIANSGISFPSGQIINVSSTANFTNNGNLEITGSILNISEGGILEVTGNVSVDSNYGGADWNINGYFVIHNGIVLSCNLYLAPDVGSNGGIYIDYGGDGTADLCDANEQNYGYVCSSENFCSKLNDNDDDTYSPADAPDLPVNLISFTGTKTLNGFLLEWTTASEQNSERFDIEVSDDKRNWQVINSLAAAGNSDVKLDYEYLDISQSKYYRLAQYDFDGTVAYYGILTSLNEGEINVSVYPTFVENGELSKVYFEGISEDQKITYQVFDIKGNELKSEFLTTSTSGNFLTSFMMPNTVDGGLYIVKVNVGKYQKSFKVIKK